MTPDPAPPPVTRREIWAWAAYDWANSAYTSLSITVLVYFVSLAAAGEQTHVAQQVAQWTAAVGRPIAAKDVGAVAWSWGIALSMLVAALLSPVVGAMADARAAKRAWLTATALSGAAGSVILACLPVAWGWTILALFVLVSLLFELSFGFYNAFLPELASEESMDRVSAFGFACGYVGGGIALAIQALVYTFGVRLGLHDAAGEPDRVAQFRVGLAIMGLWWGLFSLPAILVLRDRAPPRGAGRGLLGTARTAFAEVGRTLRNFGHYPMLALFLVGFLFYNDGIQTVISQASIFAEKDLNFDADELLLLILTFQFICLPGAIAVSRVTRWLGQKRTLLATLAIWVLALELACFVETKLQFWLLSLLLGLVMGGAQSVARAMMAVMTPPARTAEFMGFFNFSGRATSWVGTFLFGAVIARSGSARLAVLSLLVLFVVGVLITLPVNVARGQREAALRP
jgi:UMF1 family MFS transporter